jgi:hypothetical protein
MEVTSNLMLLDQLNASCDAESNGLKRASNRAFSTRYRPPHTVSGKSRTSQRRRVLRDHYRSPPESSSFSVVKLMYGNDSLALHPVSATDACQKQVKELDSTIVKQTIEPVSLPLSMRGLKPTKSQPSVGVLLQQRKTRNVTDTYLDKAQ